MYVAFTEIPQRELRVQTLDNASVSVFKIVAFTEIPQRELREATLKYAKDVINNTVVVVLHSPKSHKGN